MQVYEDLGGYEDVKVTMEGLLELYNAKHKPLNLVFFEDALQHLVRILRTITLPQGNNLLVGVGGSGKQSLARLAAYTAQCGVFEITLSRGYDEVALREDLKVRSDPAASPGNIQLYANANKTFATWCGRPCRCSCVKRSRKFMNE